MNRRNALMFALLLLSGCTHVGNVEPASSVKSDETYFVVGVEPVNAGTSFERGTIANNRYERGIDVFAAFAGYPVDGFIVGKVPAGQAYGLTNARLRSSEHDIFPTAFLPCGDAKVIAFTAVGGKVVYLTHVLFRGTPHSSRIGAEYHQDFDAARRFMLAHYPRLADKLEQGEFSLLRSGADTCL